MTRSLVGAFVGSITLVASALLAFGISEAAEKQDYASTVSTWRAEREARLNADDGWLTVAGLFFLSEGNNTFGSSPLNDIVLRTGPATAGTFILRDGVISVQSVPNQTLIINGHNLSSEQLWPYENRDLKIIEIGPLRLFAHYSGDRLAIRMRDRDSEIRQTFTGLQWFPVDESYKVKGHYKPHTEPYTLELPNILGDIELFPSSGSVTFTIDGKQLTMTAVDAGDQLWFIFRDLTSGNETYPAARFLYANPPDNDGWTVIDFNRAYNPPCAFNPHTTCPLPPLENRLPVRVEAGELDYHSAN